MSRQLQLFLCAVQMLTRIPTPALRWWSPDWIARSAVYYPVVGALVGGICAAVLWLASRAWSGALPALLAVGAGVLVTGAFHEDGLADAADGLLGGSTPERRRAIMKDSRIGSYGALAMGLVLAVKVAALAQTPLARGAVALVAAHAGGRAAAVVLMRLLPYAGDAAAAKLKPGGEGVRTAEMLAALALGLCPLFLLPWDVALRAALAGAVVAALVLRLAWRRIGGWTGDVAGAVEQGVEAAVLLALAARWS